MYQIMVSMQTDVIESQLIINYDFALQNANCVSQQHKFLFCCAEFIHFLLLFNTILERNN